MWRDRLIQLALWGVVAASLTAAALVSGSMRSRQKELGLVTRAADENIVKDPWIALLQIAPGGLRAPFVTYLWIRSQRMKDEGKLFDAKQLRDLICDQMPLYAGVLGYHAWDMAWNISVQTHTPEERWMWVHNGIQLLRDKGLFHNPKDILLHRELAWIFFSKMGQYTDEMHMAYKSRWAAKMQRVLGAPPFTAEAKQVVEAFRPIAEAPDDADALKADRDAAGFLQTLGQNGMKPDEASFLDTFLQYYNRFSPDPGVAEFQWERTGPAAAERWIAELIRSSWNDAEQANSPGLAKVLAFVRRKILKQRYKMEPEWMLALMEKYGPLDWRQVNAHAIFWATIGLKRAQGLDVKDIQPINTGRILLGGLKSLTRTGYMYYTPNHRDPERPFIDWQPDWRFIEPTHQAYLTAGLLLVGDRKRLHADQNPLAGGHITYLVDAIMQLYLGGREADADHYYQELKDLFKPLGRIYERPVREFVLARLRELGTPPADLARAFWQASLRNAYRALAGGNHAGYLSYHKFARQWYQVFRDDTGKQARLRPPPFRDQERDFLGDLMLRPHKARLYVPLLAKVRLWRSLTRMKEKSDILRQLYPAIEGPLRRECERQKVDFEKAFPPPPGYVPKPAQQQQAARG